MRKDQFGLLHHNNERDIKANTKETNLIEITKLKNDNKYIEIESNERMKNKYETNCVPHCKDKCKSKS